MSLRTIGNGTPVMEKSEKEEEVIALQRAVQAAKIAK